MSVNIENAMTRVSAVTYFEGIISSLRIRPIYYVGIVSEDCARYPAMSQLCLLSRRYRSWIANYSLWRKLELWQAERSLRNEAFAKYKGFLPGASYYAGNRPIAINVANTDHGMCDVTARRLNYK
ncbi:hypothetical protein QLX08_008081 [Tetragonisca angustula]|uniref:Uncharacterized protein n=1 Tax=Tetragonisca angustula TaxID=166442 RepID=A0AAW0ZNL4_9HYME